MYQQCGKVLLMNGTYGTNANGFSLYLLLCEDNKGKGQPITQYFTKTEKRRSLLVLVYL